MALLTARDAYAVPTHEAYVAKHAAVLADMAKHGSSEVVHDAPETLEVYANHGRWIGDCGCGSGVPVVPEWPDARCFGCGAVYGAAQVSLPARWEAVAAELERRPIRALRNARHDETPDGLAAEFAAKTGLR